MTVEQMLDLFERQVAPVKLSDDFCAEFKMYDNSGIIINCGNEVSGALFSLDLSEAAVERAIQSKVNLIVTHHPAIYGGISRFDLKTNSHARALAECIKHGISVISMHLNSDAAPQGIDYYLMKGLGGTDCEVLAPVEGGGYGRAYSVKPVQLSQLLRDTEKTFCTERVICHGITEKTVKKIASFCGAGCDDNAVAFAKRHNADVFVSSDLSHHHILELVESGISVIQLTHYGAEAYGFRQIYNSIKEKLNVPSEYFFDERFA